MKFKNKFETGRSMVEIIGVLAVVGVLSVGGIMGYSYGMDRYKANETVKGLTLRALDIQSQVDKCSGEICDVSIDGWEDDTPYTITMEDDGLLHIKGVSSRVCKIIGDLLMDSAAVYVEGVKYDSSSTTDPCDTSNNHALFFDFDPAVLADMEDVGHQPEDTPALTTEILYASNPGNEEEDITTTEDTTLATVGEAVTTTTEAELNTTTGLPLPLPCSGDTPLVDIEGNCYSCDTELVINSPNCHVCSNRIDWGDGTCELGLPLPTTAGQNETTVPINTPTPEVTETPTLDTITVEPTTTPEPETTVPVVTLDYASKVRELTEQNPGCPAAYYDSSTQMIYFYASWDSCWVRKCWWQASEYGSGWVCEM